MGDERNIPSVLRQFHWAGDHCQGLMNARMLGFWLKHLEIDEMWTFCLKLQGRLTMEERSAIGNQYLWLAVDETTKLVPAFLAFRNDRSAALSDIRPG